MPQHPPPLFPSPPRLAVLGSVNMDLVVRTDHLPAPGETVIAETSAAEFPGGKGANQAVAAARAGGETVMIGRVGGDAFAERLMANFDREGIDRTAIVPTADVSSGLAIVSVDSHGENAIIVVPGANTRVSPADVAASGARIKAANVLLVQLEIPVETVLEAIRLARQHGVRVILDPAPVPSSIPEGLLDVDLVCPNRAEASQITGRRIASIEDAREAIDSLHAGGASNVIITLGGDGAVVSDGRSVEWIEPFPIRPVDCTAAGDAFVAALAVRWAEGASLLVAARFASVAGAIAATRQGAQPGMPNRLEIEQLLSQSVTHL